MPASRKTVVVDARVVMKPVLDSFCRCRRRLSSDAGLVGIVEERSPLLMLRSVV